jgi:hypothetical protein
MATVRKTEVTGISGENSEEKPAKKKRGENLVPYHFKPGESGNPSGRPKGTTAKEMLRRQINRVVVDLQGKPSKDGIVRGDLLSNTVVTRAIAGDMRAAAIVYQYDQDRPISFEQREVPPVAGTEVNVTVNAQAIATAQVESRKDPRELVRLLDEYYGLARRDDVRLSG